MIDDDLLDLARQYPRRTGWDAGGRLYFVETGLLAVEDDAGYVSRFDGDVIDEFVILERREDRYADGGTRPVLIDGSVVLTPEAWADVDEIRLERRLAEEERAAHELAVGLARSDRKPVVAEAAPARPKRRRGRPPIDGEARQRVYAYLAPDAWRAVKAIADEREESVSHVAARLIELGLEGIRSN